WSPDLGIPPVVQGVIAWVELGGGVMIALGAGTRPAALAIAAIQVGAIFLVTGQREFIAMKRLGPEMHGYRFATVGWEDNFALLTMCVTLLLLGSGTWSVNNVVLSWLRRRKEPAPPPSPAPAMQG